MNTLTATDAGSAGVGRGVQTVMPVTSEADLEGALLLYLGNGIDSIHTERAYRRHIRKAFEVMGWPTIGGLTAAMLAEWRTALLADGRGMASHKQALASVRAFLNWAAAFGGLNINKAALDLSLRAPKGGVKRPYTVLTKEEVRRLLDACTRTRDRAALMVLLGGGLRVAEAVAVDVNDFRMGEDGWILHVRKGKGGRQRLVPIEQEVIEAVEEYLLDSGRLHGSTGPLLLSEDRAQGAERTGRLSVRGLRLVVSDTAVAARLAKRCTPHSLRHTYAIEALRRWRDLVAVSRLLGHRDVRTTMIYLEHFELGELRAHVPKWK